LNSRFDEVTAESYTAIRNPLGVIRDGRPLVMAGYKQIRLTIAIIEAQGVRTMGAVSKHTDSHQ